jgi:hypothetical protein
MPSVARKNQFGRKPSLWFAVSALFVSLIAAVPAASAADSQLANLDYSGLALPDGITATLVAEDSKVPNVTKEGSKPYSCLAIYLVSSLSVPTVVHVSDLSLAEEDGGDSILYGGSLSGYLTIPPNTLDSAYLASSQALGRLSPAGYFSNPLSPKATSAGALPDVLNCQSADLGRMFGLTIQSRVNYLINHDLYLTGSVDLATPSTYDISSVTVPDGYTPTLKYRDSEGYSVSCITRDGRSTTIGVALKKDNTARTYITSSGTYIARNITVDGTEYASPGIPNVRSACIPVAVVPNDDTGDITGDREIFVTADISKWSAKVSNKIKVAGTAKMAKLQFGATDSDSAPVTYDPSIDKSFVWLTAKSRGTLAKCTGTTFSFTKVAATYQTDDGTSKGTLLVKSSSARKYPNAITSSSGVDSYAVLSIPGNVFLSDGKLTVTGDVTATDKCTR